jgi:adenine-specific DNA-methyltransferase
MKYMGHKGKLLKVLGDILIEESQHASRIADPFCGSGVVSWFLAKNTDKRLVSGDLQTFAVARAAAVVSRTSPLATEKILLTWLANAQAVIDQIACLFPSAHEALSPNWEDDTDIPATVERCRAFCSVVVPPILLRIGGSFPMTRAYGGHYFSPRQAIQLDALRQTLPADASARRVALAALIEVASKCAASPGHTAQPFQPTPTAGKYVFEAWRRDVFELLHTAMEEISGNFARVKGSAETADCLATIQKLGAGDLVFADPPYSDVHYSRFYHVLETIARGEEVAVEGKGRYPAAIHRPVSEFSRKGQAMSAAQQLIGACIKKEVSLVLTFPTTGASNGLTTKDFVDLGRKRFSSIEVREVQSKFSTLGGQIHTRGGRKACAESIVCFRF